MVLGLLAPCLEHVAHETVELAEVSALLRSRQVWPRLNSAFARRPRLPHVVANMPDAMVVKCYACGTFQVVKQHLPMQNRFTCKVTQCKIEQPMNAFADKGVVLRSYDVREMVAAAKRLNAEKLEQRSKGVLSHQKDRIMQELNEKRALRLEQSRMLVAYGNVH